MIVWVIENFLPTKLEEGMLDQTDYNRYILVCTGNGILLVYMCAYMHSIHVFHVHACTSIGVH